MWESWQKVISLYQQHAQRTGERLVKEYAKLGTPVREVNTQNPEKQANLQEEPQLPGWHKSYGLRDNYVNKHRMPSRIFKRLLATGPSMGGQSRETVYKTPPNVFARGPLLLFQILALKVTPDVTSLDEWLSPGPHNSAINPGIPLGMVFNTL